MFTSPNMGLTIWNLLTDLFDYTQLESNFSAIDAHDHSSGKGLQIGTAGLANGAVTGAKLASNTIEGSNIDPSASLTIGKVTAANKSTFGNLKYGTANLTVGTSTAYVSSPINHGCLDGSGNPATPLAINITAHFNIPTAKAISGSAVQWGIDYGVLGSPPSTTQFQIYAISNAGFTASGTTTIKFAWVAYA